MVRSINRDEIVLILALIFMGVRVNLVGSISLTEIFVLFQIPSLYHWVKGNKLPYLKTVCILFLLLALVQAIAEFAVGNTLVNAARGIAITIMALLLFLFFLRILCRDISLIKWIPVALLIKLVLWGDQFGFAETGESTYFKFFVAPVLTYIVCYFSLIRNSTIHRNIFTIFLITSLFIISGGARSAGFSLLFSAVIYALYRKYKSLNLKKALPGILIAVIVFQLFYALLYVPKVASGEWGSPQNREQLARINNSKNVFMLLFSARADFYISYLAFLDKPLWGHGAWAKDTDFKYALIQAKLFPKDEVKIDKDVDRLVPAHSVVMGMGSRNGILALILIICIFYVVYRVAIKALWISSPYNVYLIFMIISSFQHLLFGPSAILKNNGAIAFAIFFALYYWKEFNTKWRYEIQTNCSDGNL